MDVDVPDLTPGAVDLEHFELLLSDTATSGEKVIAALRDYLVYGVDYKEATTNHGANVSQFYKRLNSIKKKHIFAAKVSKFYTKA